MAVKSEVSHDRPSGLSRYPMLGELKAENRTHSAQRLIVLFHEAGCGTVLHENRTAHVIGNYTRGLVMSNFEPMRGAITLSNED